MDLRERGFRMEGMGGEMRGETARGMQYMRQEKKLKKEKFHLDILLTFRNCMNPITFSIRNNEDMLATFSFTDFYRHQTVPKASSSQSSQIVYLGYMKLWCDEMHWCS